MVVVVKGDGATGRIDISMEAATVCSGIACMRANKCVRELVPFFDGDIRADVFLRRLHMRVRMFIREHMKIMMYGCLYFKIRTYGHARVYIF